MNKKLIYSPLPELYFTLTSCDDFFLMCSPPPALLPSTYFPAKSGDESVMTVSTLP